MGQLALLLGTSSGASYLLHSKPAVVAECKLISAHTMATVLDTALASLIVFITRLGKYLKVLTHDSLLVTIQR